MTQARHIVAFSGGKDSSALAIYLHHPDRWRRALGKTDLPPRAPLAEAEYVFCDTGTELDETYAYLDRLEAYLGRPIRRLSAEAPPGETPFDHHLRLYGGFLPSAQMRWCTRKLKLEPYERYVGDAPVVSYVGIRGDEPDRVGYISTKPNITSVFPFKEDGIAKADVYRILDESGVGMPEYYDWRSRSGCYFCFYQRRSEWVGLLENHPHLFEAGPGLREARPGDGRGLHLERRRVLGGALGPGPRRGDQAPHGRARRPRPPARRGHADGAVLRRGPRRRGRRGGVLDLSPVASPPPRGGAASGAGAAFGTEPTRIAGPAVRVAECKFGRALSRVPTSL